MKTKRRANEAKFDTFPKNADCRYSLKVNDNLHVFQSSRSWGGGRYIRNVAARDKLRSRLIIKFAADIHRHSPHSLSSDANTDVVQMKVVTTVTRENQKITEAILQQKQIL